MKRSKYKCKNIHEYKRLRECSHPFCKAVGFVTYWDDPDAEHRKVEHRCIEHVHWVKPTTEAKKPNANLYTPMTDFRKWLDIGNYHTGLGM